MSEPGSIEDALQSVAPPAHEASDDWPMPSWPKTEKACKQILLDRDERHRAMLDQLKGIKCPLAREALTSRIIASDKRQEKLGDHLKTSNLVVLSLFRTHSERSTWPNRTGRCQAR
jgi:hypothetical protein